LRVVGAVAAALDHETVDHAVEDEAVEMAGLHVVEEIGDGLRRGIRIELDPDLARRRVELDLRIGGGRLGRGRRLRERMGAEEGEGGDGDELTDHACSWLRTMRRRVKAQPRVE
jgi:hypothetical protein